jgi:hypothetical protein
MKPGKNIIYTILVIGIIVVLIAVIHFFTGKKEKTDRYQVKPRETRTLEPIIAKVEIEPPEPTSIDDIKANAMLKDPTMKYVKFQYQWFVNGERVPGIEDPYLEKQHYKRGDIVYCRVKATRGIYESKIVKSQEVKIKNSMPLIISKPWGNVKPGDRFQYSINAQDPDGDTLTYRLVSPLDLGIKVDPKTGDIRWNIPQPEPIAIDSDIEWKESRPGEGYDESAISKAPPVVKRQKELPNIVKIVFEVRDTEGATAVSSIKLDFTERAGKPR